MIPVAFYLLKVTLCSGVLFGYYVLALRNKTFHQWNRFYLLACVVLSLAAPLLKITIGNNAPAMSASVFRMLNVVSAGEDFEVESSSHAAFTLTAEQLVILLYLLVSAILFLIIVAGSVRIYNLLRAYPKTKLDGICFLNTDAKGTPFSFFNYIVWNRAIDLTSETGQRIFQHELAHVQQRHTWDKVFILLILVPFWCNPFFWLMRNELHALHEFAADQKAATGDDATALSQMILNTAFPEKHMLFTNPFFQSIIKRRLAMFTTSKNRSVSYWSRIVALPFFVLVLSAFAVKMAPVRSHTFLAPDKPITVVIDAGHGNKKGAQAGDIYEGDITLAIAKKIKEQNKNSTIHIVLTREDGEEVALPKRVEIASENKADLFISVHINATATDMDMNGMEVVVSNKNPPYQQQSEVLGSALVQQLGRVYRIEPNLMKKQVGIWIIDKNVCPSVLIECGYLTNKKDRDFITKDNNQALIADKILDAIAQYGVLKNTTEKSVRTDTVPKQIDKNKTIANVNKTSRPDTPTLTLTEISPLTIEKDTTPAAGDIIVEKRSFQDAASFKGVIELDGKIFNGTAKELPVTPDQIASISVLKGEAIEKEYGLKQGESLLSVMTKTYSEGLRQNRDPATKPVFTETEIEPKFSENKKDWADFLKKNLNAAVAVEHGAPAGTYKVEVQFVVAENGKLSDIKPVTRFGYGMEDEVVRLIKISPDWIPAKQNGHNVTAYHKQPVTFVIENGR